MILFETFEVRRGALSLRGRRFHGGVKTPALCLPGLTRNSRDFEEAAPMIAATGRDVYALSFRGRGESDRDPDFLNYHPQVYCDDVLAALDALCVRRAVLVGTSLGGIVAMLAAAAAPARVAGAVLNDIGPDIAPEGIARILGYVGAERAAAASLDEAAIQCRAINEIAFPKRDHAFWRRFALRTFRQAPDGRWTPDYDAAIGRALAEGAATPDLWPAFASLKKTPTLVVRGALSDILTPPILEKMRTVYPDFALCEIANTGHAPMLSEPDAQQAIEALLAPID